MRTIYFLLFFGLISLSSFAQRKHIVRGHSPGEIFISSWWYIDTQTGDIYSAVFYSNDNGEAISIRYFNEIYSADMTIGNLSSDKSSGVIYNWWNRKLWMSEDGGYSWQENMPPGNFQNEYAAGCTQGEVYMLNNDFGLYRSTDYGVTFSLVNDDPQAGHIEVGSEPDEVYVLSYAYADTVSICYSSNGGSNFTINTELDSATGGIGFGSQSQIISRGNSSGELYFVSWQWDHTYRIYYSSNYGQSMELRYASNAVDEWVRSFTAGYEPGSFYMTYSEYFSNGNVKLHIEYSSDTAKTFTEYVHLLTPDFPVSVAENLPNNEQDIQCYPNPFSEKTTIKLNGTKSEDASIGIYSIEGKLLRVISAGKNQQSIEWNGCDATGRVVPSGVYLIKVSDGQYSKMQKIVKR